MSLSALATVDEMAETCTRCEGDGDDPDPMLTADPRVGPWNCRLRRIGYLRRRLLMIRATCAAWARC